VELAGALAEIARVTMRDDFRAIDPRSARIVLVEGVGRVLPSYPERLSAAAARSLQELGVEVRTRTLVTDLGPEHVLLRSADATEKMATRTVLWAAGIQASPLARAVAAATGAPQDRAGRVLVEPDCSVPGYPEILVAGDMAASTDRGGTTLPGVAQVAMQQGGYIARLIAARLDGRTLPPFHYRDWGNMATIGRHAAVAEIVGLQFWGYLAWLAWLFVHLMKLVAFQNRLLVFVQWAWSYFSHNRAARLITGSRGAPRTEG
ncbi:MAG TPA: FAD-dependent oxidoreductase, partial [Thermoanaerobaculaceae bacterium]|nr:FAD-dependent oxidoreductase [Thermoanaerobaculaceae bacterium]